MEITLHKYQAQAIMSGKRIIALVSGIQGGKTFIGSLWMRKMISTYKNFDDTFIVAAPDYKIMSQSTMPRFLNVMKGLGEYNKKEDVFKLSDGRRIYCRSMRDADSVEGIAGCRGIWVDEAGKITSKAWINLQGRAAPREAQIFITTTPYALNWVYKDLYKPVTEGKRQDVECVQFQSLDNPYFPKAEFERQKAIQDPRIFAMKYCGRFEKMAGLVFMDFDMFNNSCDSFAIDYSKFYMCAGVDWGYTNPYALSVRAINKQSGEDYQIAEFYQSSMDPVEKLEVAKQFKKQYRIEAFYCDNEEPATISLFNKAGLNALAAPKYSGSLTDNIARHNEIVKNGKYKIWRGKCPHTEDEYATYHYPEADGGENNSEEQPIDANNHLITANLYATQCTQHIRNRLEPAFKPDKTHLEKLLAGEYAEKPRNRLYEVID